MLLFYYESLKGGPGLKQHTENCANVGIIIYEERPSSGVSLHHSRSGTDLVIAIINSILPLLF